MTRMPGLRGSPERAFESLYKRHVAEVYRYAVVMLESPADAEDVTQTTFLNAYRALLRGERPRAAGRWLRVIAHNLCLQHFRQAARRPREVELEDEAAVLVDDEDRVSADDLTRALGQIPVNQRAALVMRELEGRPIAEIAEILAVSAAAALPARAAPPPPPARQPLARQPAARAQRRGSPGRWRPSSRGRRCWPAWSWGPATWPSAILGAVRVPLRACTSTGPGAV